MDPVVNYRMCRIMGTLAAVKRSLADKKILHISTMLPLSAVRSKHTKQTSIICQHFVLCCCFEAGGVRYEDEREGR